MAKAPAPASGAGGGEGSSSSSSGGFGGGEPRAAAPPPARSGKPQKATNPVMAAAMNLANNEQVVVGTTSDLEELKEEVAEVVREALNLEDEDPLEGQYVPHYTAFPDKEEYNDLVARVKEATTGNLSAFCVKHFGMEKKPRKKKADAAAAATAAGKAPRTEPKKAPKTGRKKAPKKKPALAPAAATRQLAPAAEVEARELPTGTMDGLKMLYPSRRAEPQPRGKAPDDFTSLAAKAKDNCLNTLVLALGSGDSSAAARIKQLESELELERGLREGLEKQVAAFKKRMADIMQNPDIEGAWQAAAAANTCEWPRTPTRTRTHSPPRASPTRFPNPTAPPERARG